MGNQIISWLLLLSQIYLSFHLHNRVSGECVPKESSALLQLKQDMDSPQTSKFTSWESGTDCCSWEGVACNGAAGQVIGLDLSGSNLSGSIPSLLTNLTQLVSLDLSKNSFTGQISSLFTLPSLKDLKLYQNRFSGRLDEFNVSSSLLESIDLDYNMLNGSIPVSMFKLESLSRLTLSSNNFSGTVELDMFRNMKNLSHLDISHNSLSINTSFISSFPQVQYLNLGSCNITEFPDFLKTQEKLNYLDLSNNNMKGQIPNWIWAKSTFLSYLNLSHNLLDGVVEPNFPNTSLMFMTSLDISYNNLKGSIPNLQTGAFVLDYSNNNFSSIPSNISFPFFLKYFSLSNNNLIGEIPSSICGSRSLGILDMSNNHLSGLIPECLGTMYHLGVLSLRNNNFSGSMPQTFTERSSMRTLDLNGNQLEGEVPRSLANCMMLEVLDIGNNKINDTFPFWLNPLSLRVLVLRSNRFHGSINHPTINYTFPMLQIVDLSSNNFTGNLSSEWLLGLKGMMAEKELSQSNGDVLGYGNGQEGGIYYQDKVILTWKGQDIEFVKILTIFTSLDLSNNKFQGDIPEAIGDLSSLHVLNMSGNSLTGHIPSSLENLMQLESLDLSRNELSGNIPLQLADLTFLSVLNLSQNLLVGNIPQARQFLTFSNDSYQENLGLCGPPLSIPCKDYGKEASAPPSIFEQFHESQLDWSFVWSGFGVGYGFGGGIGIVVGFVACRRGRRRWS